MGKVNDLSQRQRVPAPPLPTFNPRSYKIGSADESGTVDLFAPNAAVTVQWILLAVSGAVTIQLLENGEPVGLALTVSGAALIKYPGRFIANNTKLSVSLSADVTINWEVVFVKEFFPGLISLESAVYPL